MLELTRGALHRTGEAVAQRGTPTHHRAALTGEAKARSVRCGNHAGARRLRRAQLGEPETGHKRVHVHDVGARALQPGVKQLRAANHHAPLRLLARHARRNRVAVDAATAFLVGPLPVTGGLGRGDEHIVPTGAQPLRELGDVDLGTAGGCG